MWAIREIGRAHRAVDPAFGNLRFPESTTATLATRLLGVKRGRQSGIDLLRSFLAQVGSSRSPRGANRTMKIVLLASQPFCWPALLRDPGANERSSPMEATSAPGTRLARQQFRGSNHQRRICVLLQQVTPRPAPNHRARCTLSPERQLQRAKYAKSRTSTGASRGSFAGDVRQAGAILWAASALPGLFHRSQIGDLRSSPGSTGLRGGKPARSPRALA